MFPGSTSIIHMQRRLLSYGKGYPGDRILPDDSPLKRPPHSAGDTEQHFKFLTKLFKSTYELHKCVHVQVKKDKDSPSICLKVNIYINILKILIETRLYI